jgi:hypothetical protein
MPIVLLNYTHPLTSDQLAQVAALLGEPPDQRRIAVQVDRARPLAEVAAELADAAALGPAEWQTSALLINPPALAPVALALAAELHGRCGYFPAMLNVRPIAGANPPRYEIAEVVNLQAIRDLARTRR